MPTESSVTETEQKHEYVVSDESNHKEHVFVLPEEVAERWRGQDITVDPNGSPTELKNVTVVRAEEHNA